MTNTTTLTKTQAQTLRALIAKGGQATTEEVANLMGTADSTMRSRLRKLEALGLVEALMSEGTYNNGSSALRQITWCCEGTDDEDIRTALGLAPLISTDGWYAITEITSRSDGYLNVTVTAIDMATVTTPVHEDFAIEQEMRAGDLALVEFSDDGEASIVDIQSTGDGPEPTPPAPEAPSTPRIVVTPRASVAPQITVTARPRAAGLSISVAELTAAVMRTAPVLGEGTRGMAPMPSPLPVAGAGESPLAVEEASLRPLSRAEQAAELVWIGHVCREACALVGLDWDRTLIQVGMRTSFTRRLGDALGTNLNWAAPGGRIRFSASPLWRRASKAERRNTVIHELAHVLVNCYHGRRVTAHGSEWKAMHRLLGEAPSRTHSVNRAGLRRRRPLVRDRFGIAVNRYSR